MKDNSWVGTYRGRRRKAKPKQDVFVNTNPGTTPQMRKDRITLPRVSIQHSEVKA
jgi:hypothetical protein